VDAAGEFLVAKALDALPGFSLVDEFLLCYGRPFPVKAAPPDAPRLTKQSCFRNAWLLVRESIALTYGEGYCLAVNGEFFEHAWAVTAEGSAVDPTIPPAEVRDYFGVAYDRDDYFRWVGECPPDQGVLWNYTCANRVIRSLNKGWAPVLLAEGFAQTPPEG
jgi:hypothetical protein